MEETIRAFVAIELSDEIKQALARLIAQLRNADLGNLPPQAVATAGKGLRWVQPDTVHLTLKFLGDIPATRTKEIEDALANCASLTRPFSLTSSKLGAFPNLKAPRVLWIGLDGELTALMGLQQCIENSLLNIGFPKEDHPFSPHLTLARVRDYSSKRRRPSYEEVLSLNQPTNAVSMTVQYVSLMKSTLTPAGAIHTRLAHVKLR